MTVEEIKAKHQPRQQHEAMRKYLDVLGKRCALEGIVL